MIECQRVERTDSVSGVSGIPGLAIGRPTLPYHEAQRKLVMCVGLVRGLSSPRTNLENVCRW